MGQALTTTQFFLTGKRHFTRTGYLRHAKLYGTKGGPDGTALDEVDAKGRVAVVTGANSGIGKEICTYLAKRGATVFMVCRSQERGEKAMRDISEASKPGTADLKLVLGDMSLQGDVRRVVKEVEEQAPGGRVDTLVCNAGALLNSYTVTKENVETTLACHLAFGTYLLTNLCRPLLLRSTDPRVVVVSSGGMLNTPLPSWGRMSVSRGEKSYDGTMAYAFAKRGQVLLAERWAKTEPRVPVVSCHPGWTDTPGVEDAFGGRKKYLEPMRTLWEGAEGICWLCVTDGRSLESGAFYLDREPQRKHLSYARTHNTEEDVDELIANLDVLTGEKQGRPIEQDYEVVSNQCSPAPQCASAIRSERSDIRVERAEQAV